jgi:hypothetical protein
MKQRFVPVRNLAPELHPFPIIEGISVMVCDECGKQMLPDGRYLACPDHEEHHLPTLLWEMYVNDEWDYDDDPPETPPNDGDPLWRMYERGELFGGDDDT